MKAMSARVRPTAHSILLPIVAALLLLVAVDRAAAINRCEGRDGRVTYTDEPCPTTARSARRVDDSPPVVARDAPAKAALAEPDKDAKAAETKAAPRDAAEAGKAAAAPALQAGRITASAGTEQEILRLDELRLRQQRQCAELTRRIDFARSDLQAASGVDRASTELALRRLQEEARSVCPPR